MRKTARAICMNDVPENFSDVIPNNAESFFIQVCDFISYFSHLYFKCVINKNPLPSRVQSVIDTNFIIFVMEKLKNCGKLNLTASKENEYGLAIYPK